MIPKLLPWEERKQCIHGGFSLFNSFFHCTRSPVLHNFELIGTRRVFQNTLSGLSFTRTNFVVD